MCDVNHVPCSRKPLRSHAWSRAKGLYHGPPEGCIRLAEREGADRNEVGRTGARRRDHRSERHSDTQSEHLATVLQFEPRRSTSGPECPRRRVPGGDRSSLGHQIDGKVSTCCCICKNANSPPAAIDRAAYPRRAHSEMRRTSRLCSVGAPRVHLATLFLLDFCSLASFAESIETGPRDRFPTRRPNAGGCRDGRLGMPQCRSRCRRSS